MPITLNSRITEMAGVGDFYARKLEKLGVKTVRDLLFYFPRRWEDFSHITPIAAVKVGEAVSVRGVVFDIKNKKSRKGTTVTEAIVSDDTGSIKAVWFNQPFLINTLKKGDEVYLAGTLEFSFNQASFPSPAYEKVHGEGLEDLRHVGRIIPIYAETEGVSSKWLRSKIAPLAKLVYGIKDHLPEEVKKEHKLVDLSAAVRSMHYPETPEDLKRAQRRFLIDNLFCLFLVVLSGRSEVRKNKALSIPYDEEVGNSFVKSLPFELTDSQRKATWEILKDLTKNYPMNRLLEGDVGSGKTVVAAMAALMVAKRGYQAVILAPTEILATQHFQSFTKILKGFDVKTELLLGSQKSKEKQEALKRIEDGEAQVIIGTHALLSEKVKYWTLGLVIVDEQHRFGVKQRESLRKVNETGLLPHFLSMSATPIPRTLAITVFGDLDISLLLEMPKGRQKVGTFVVPPEKRQDAYGFIKERINAGEQAFVVCPLVSESDKLGVKSAEAESERLKKDIFAKEKIGLMHGKLSREEKEKVMADFKSKKIDILVATSVVEVGVDVPNATIIMIESAERFGLAQLHQFRGRVGRGDKKSWCLLFTDSKNEVTQARMDALVTAKNGFELSEKDLEIRGPGELLGISQHGKIDDTLLAVLKNPTVIPEVKKSAEQFLKEGKASQHPALLEKLQEFGTVATLE
jgi:ATP-dependent DNA helicase RecG